jgi:putative DNA methylase
MVWDYAEGGPFGDASGNADNALQWIIEVIKQESSSGAPATITRGNAAELPNTDARFDAVITDPPYYDNVSYAALADFFYVWLKRSVGHLYPEHFAAELTPKRSEIIADPYRQGSKEKARKFYEDMMQKSLAEMHRVLKPEGILTLVYAHKTVKGWETLVEALRSDGFVVQEAWPLETERGSRLIASDASALASSIFITARKHGQQKVGDYSTVRQELESIVRERVETLWGEGIGGADLLIACVGAGLRAYTKYARIELPNGEEIPAARFLGEVEGIVQEVLMEKALPHPGGSVRH